MNLNAIDIGLIVALVGITQGLIRLGDRLWGEKRTPHHVDPQPKDCAVQHTSLIDSVGGMMRVQKETADLLKESTMVIRSVAEGLAMLERVATMRHDWMVKELAVITETIRATEARLHNQIQNTNHTNGR